MKQQTMAVKFSLPRFKALEFYLDKEGKTVEGELEKHLEELYRDQVPDAVKEYVQAQNPEDQAPEQPDEPKSTKRQTRKKTHDTIEEEGQDSGPVLTM